MRPEPEDAESIAISSLFTLKRLTPAAIAYVARKQAWTPDEAALLALGWRTRVVSSPGWASRTAKQIVQLLRRRVVSRDDGGALIVRLRDEIGEAIALGDLKEAMRPPDFIRWAKDLRFPRDQKLRLPEALVAAVGPEAKSRAQLEAELAESLARIVELERLDQPLPKGDLALDWRTLHSMSRLLLVICRLRYDTLGTASLKEISEQVETDLQVSKKYFVSAKTLQRYLENGSRGLYPNLKDTRRVGPRAKD